MPDLKLVIPAVVGIAVLVLVAGSFVWLLAHPLVLVAAVASIVLLARYAARRNRV